MNFDQHFQDEHLLDITIGVITCATALLTVAEQGHTITPQMIERIKNNASRLIESDLGYPSEDVNSFITPIIESVIKGQQDAQ